MVLDKVIDLFTHENMSGAFGFFIGSFSRELDHLGQWRTYGSNGRGFSLGLAPHLFHVEQGHRKPHENVFVAPVVYGNKPRDNITCPRSKAIRIVGETVEHAADLMEDRSIGKPFLDEMATALMASQMIFNSLTIKHEAYWHESEVRLIIIGHENLTPYISTRSRRGDIVPFIKSDMLIQANGSVVEVVVGPSAPDSAEDGVRALFKPFHGAPASIVRRSTIPPCDLIKCELAVAARGDRAYQRQAKKPLGKLPTPITSASGRFRGSARWPHD